MYSVGIGIGGREVAGVERFRNKLDLVRGKFGILIYYGI